MELRDQIMGAYADHLREHGAPPATVFKFVQGLSIDERSFFSEFPNFDAVESALWKGMVQRVAQAVSGGDEWIGFSARQRVLTFLFAFCEESLAWRSLLLLRVGKCGPLSRAAHVKGLETGFKEFMGPVIEHGMASGEIVGRGPLTNTYPEVFYLHFRAVIDFHLKDDSAGYERTDALIEKSVALAFDLLGKQAVDSAFDLAKFVFVRPT